MCSVLLGWLNLMVTVVEKVESAHGNAGVEREASACFLTERKYLHLVPQPMGLSFDLKIRPRFLC